MKMKKSSIIVLFFSILLFTACSQSTKQSETSEKIEILFLGHNSEHHHSEKYAPILATALFKKGINISYTADPEDLNEANLNNYDGLIIYANHDEISQDQEKALLEFVENGKGFIPIHCASFCFRNSEKYVNLVGAQFKSHETGTFVAEIVDSTHAAMQGVKEFETWDETYVHHMHNEDKVVLMERVEAGQREPWTWTREQGKGRIFYTAYGHDERTWSHPEFHTLIEKGILWAVGDKAKEKLSKLQLPQLTYTDAEIPNYERRDPPPQFQAPLSPEESQKLIQVPPGFELQLFASEPDIINPIAMAWDERGRLWVIETVDYPNTVRDDKGEGDDRIKICEDTDGDGKADKFTVFADKLNIPTSMVFTNGGIIVSQAPHFFFLKDTDGDDKADAREEIISGWGIHDTHAGPSNLKYGLDNMLWGTVGYSGFEGTISGKEGRLEGNKLKFGQGIYRFTPDGKQLEFISSTSNNTWGLGFSETFDVFVSTANNTHSAYLSVPNRYLVNINGMSGKGITKIDGHYDMRTVTDKIRQVDVHGGFTAAAGHNLYTARSFPQEYWNRIAFVCEPTGRILHNAILEPQGAGFAEKDGWNLLASADDWFAPVHAEVGPDGAVWVLDWYNFIIQHNPTPKGFENGKGNAHINPLRDRQHGRIYRVAHTGSNPSPAIELDIKDPESLVSGLKSENMFWRTTAQRLIVESGNKAVIPALLDLVNNQSVDEIGLNSPAVHALWTLHGLGALQGNDDNAMKAALGALNHPAAGVRKTAVKVLPKNQKTMDAIMKVNLLNDKDPKVKMEVFLAIAEMPASEELGKQVYQATKAPENTDDSWLSLALFASSSAHKDGFLTAYNTANEENVYELGKGNLAQQIKYRSSFEVYPLEGGHLVGAGAPDVKGKEIMITGLVEKKEKPLYGMLAVQGGEDDGYALYIKEDRLHFLVKQNGKKKVISSSSTLPDTFKVEAKLQSGGEMILGIDGKQIAKGKAAGLFSKNLDHGLRVGHASPEENRLDKFEESWFGFTGKFSTAALEVKIPGQPRDTQVAPDQIVNLKVVEHVMKFDKTSFTVEAGKYVEIVLENPDFMQHNLVITVPGSLEKVGAAADKLARDPDGAAKNYVPQIPEVLFATPLVDPEKVVKLRFMVPSKAGEYPFVCTFPGHWRIMNGIMKVVAPQSASLK